MSKAGNYGLIILTNKGDNKLCLEIIRNKYLFNGFN